jgi:hypothetical protein
LSPYLGPNLRARQAERDYYMTPKFATCVSELKLPVWPADWTEERIIEVFKASLEASEDAFTIA